MSDLPQIIRASADDRRGLFQQTGQRLSCAPENVEKDFWVCWILDALYNRAGIEERLLFKGGTSLSKAFDLIQRFSEDIDITVFRDDLPGDPFPSDDELRAMGSNQRRRKLDEMKERCSGYINGQFQTALTKYTATELEGMKFKIEPDPDDPDAQSLLFHYPSAFTDFDEAYIRRVVKIESGAKSALDPHETKTIVPYSAHDTDGLDLAVPNVLTIKPERTFCGQDHHPTRTAALVSEQGRALQGRAASVAALLRRIPPSHLRIRPRRARGSGTRGKLREARPPLLRPEASRSRPGNSRNVRHRTCRWHARSVEGGLPKDVRHDLRRRPVVRRHPR